MIDLIQKIVLVKVFNAGDILLLVRDEIVPIDRGSLTPLIGSLMQVGVGVRIAPVGIVEVFRVQERLRTEGGRISPKLLVNIVRVCTVTVMTSCGIPVVSDEL